MGEATKSAYAGAALRAVRPYLIVGDADAAIDFYRRVFDAREFERHTTPSGGVAHAKLQFGETILEIGEHADAAGRDVKRLPRIGLRLYVTGVDDTYVRAIAAGATGDAPSDRPQEGGRCATVYDPFGLTWWLVAAID
ncbi:MAG: VOC family protein [bacterium]